MTQVLTNPVLRISNSNVLYVEGTLSYNRGSGEINTRVQTAGNGSVQTVHSTVVESQYGMVKFSMRNTDQNIATIDEWLRLNNSPTGVSVNLSQSGFQGVSFSNMRITNNPDINTGNDADIELEFTGNQGV